MKKFIKNNLKLMIGLIIGAILAGSIVYAATSAKEITYTTSKNESIKNVEDALNDLYTKANPEINMELLWTNLNPLSAFAPQTININNLSQYKYIAINATYGGNGLTDDYYPLHKSILEVGTTGNITGVHSKNSPNGYAATVRKVNVTQNSIEFANGHFYNGTNVESNNYAVPLNIWGIK